MLAFVPVNDCVLSSKHAVLWSSNDLASDNEIIVTSFHSCTNSFNTDFVTLVNSPYSCMPATLAISGMSEQVRSLVDIKINGLYDFGISPKTLSEHF